MNNSNNISTRYRTAAKAFEEIKKADPNTALTENYIRTLMTNGSLPVIIIGSKTLVDMGTLLSHLASLAVKH